MYKDRRGSRRKRVPSEPQPSHTPSLAAAEPMDCKIKLTWLFPRAWERSTSAKSHSRGTSYSISFPPSLLLCFVLVFSLIRCLFPFRSQLTPFRSLTIFQIRSCTPGERSQYSKRRSSCRFLVFSLNLAPLFHYTAIDNYRAAKNPRCWWRMTLIFIVCHG